MYADDEPRCRANQQPGLDFHYDCPDDLIRAGSVQKGDRFQFFDNAASVGMTSVVANTGVDTCGGNIACAVADTGYSRLSVVLAAGAHSLTGNVITNALNSTGGAAVFSVSPIAVPEPGTLHFRGMGGALLFVSRKLRRRV